MRSTSSSKPATARRPGRPVDERLQARRREQILDAAARLFAARGYAETDTQVLADRLHVGKGTIYRYFPSKEALFLAAVDRVMHRLREAVDLAVAGLADPLERVSTAVQAYLDFFASQPGVVELLIQERAQFKDRKQPTYFEHRDANIGRWRDLFRGLIAAGTVRDISVEMITDVLSHLVYGTMFTNYFRGGQEKPSGEQAAEMLDIVFHGILAPGRAAGRKP